MFDVIGVILFCSKLSAVSVGLLVVVMDEWE